MTAFESFCDVLTSKQTPVRPRAQRRRNTCQYCLICGWNEGLQLDGGITRQPNLIRWVKRVEMSLRTASGIIGRFCVGSTSSHGR